MYCSVIIPCANRADLLQLNLLSLARQKTKHNIEVIVLNEGENDGTEPVLRSFTDFPTQYRFMDNCTGWRTPATAFNTGANMAQGEAYILSCPEMYSVNNTLDIMLDALDGAYMVIPRGMDDRDGLFLRESKCDNLHPLNTHLPFFMAVRASDYKAIGGYDENMTGISFDDDDFVARMQDAGVTHKETDARVIHLYHPRISDTIRNSASIRERWLYNKAIFDGKRRARNYL